MIADVVRLTALGLALPFGAAWGAWHRLRTSSHAILDVKVTALEDSQSRESWLGALRRIAGDSGVEGVVFHIEAPPGGWAACQDLRAVIRLLRDAGKATYAFVDAPGNAATWLATACDRVFCVPTGELQLVGVGVEMTFFGAALEHIGVRPDFEAAGAYKSFGEPFMRSFASPENLEAVDALVHDLHAQLVTDIAADRRLTPEAVQALLDRAPLAAEEAVVDGLIDKLLYKDQLDSWLEEHHGERAKRIEFDTWRRRDRIQTWIDEWGHRGGRIAVLHLDGPIVMEDPGYRTLIRARSVAPILEELRKDDKVAAVVLHVNSPGGNALASDLLWREVEQLRRKKPVVASFEDVSASGGYYLAAPAAEIFARPATLTGSIGVFGGKLVMGEGLRKLGVTSQTVLAAPNAALFSPTKRFTDAQRERFRFMLQRFYDGFVHRVAAGRRQPEEALEPHCRGRVWTGRMAETRGLVDRVGTLSDAIERARMLGGLKRDYRRVDLSGQPRRGLLQQLVHDSLKGVVPQLAQARVGAALLDRVVGRRVAEQIEVLVENEGQAMAMLPMVIETGE
ncbi:MAG: signal peptide peptidase SppA [Alphaproteobacteria bacterium]|nr:signal peptide peptidase SppA [Alphaproteobacteria bacterium]